MKKGLTNKGKLDIYDSLRDMHSIIKSEIYALYPLMSSQEQNAIDGVDSVLYLAESVFAKVE